MHLFLYPTKSPQNFITFAGNRGQEFKIFHGAIHKISTQNLVRVLDSLKFTRKKMYNPIRHSWVASWILFSISKMKVHENLFTDPWFFLFRNGTRYRSKIEWAFAHIFCLIKNNAKYFIGTRLTQYFCGSSGSVVFIFEIWIFHGAMY